MCGTELDIGVKDIFAMNRVILVKSGVCVFLMENQVPSEELNSVRSKNLLDPDPSICPILHQYEKKFETAL